MPRRDLNKTIRFNETEMYMLQQIMKLGGYSSISEAVREAVRHYYAYLVRRYREGTLYRLKEISDKLEEKREVQNQ